MNSTGNPDHLDELNSLELDELLERFSETPNDVDLLVCIGRRYFTLRQLEKTEEFYKRAIALDGNDAWTHMYIGNLHYARRQYRDAIKCFSRAVELLPDCACPYWCLGDVYDKIGKADLAEVHYEKAVAVEPDSLAAQRQLTDWYERHYTSE